jgi:hypothetical protein
MVELQRHRHFQLKHKVEVVDRPRIPGPGRDIEAGGDPADRTARINSSAHVS